MQALRGRDGDEAVQMGAGVNPLQVLQRRKARFPPQQVQVRRIGQGIEHGPQTLRTLRMAGAGLMVLHVSMGVERKGHGPMLADAAPWAQSDFTKIRRVRRSRPRPDLRGSFAYG